MDGCKWVCGDRVINIARGCEIGSSFWSEAAAKAVVVEADAFKETDVIYRAISSMGHHDDMLQTAELVTCFCYSTVRFILLNYIHPWSLWFVSGLGAPILYKRSIVATRNSPERRARCDHGRHIIMGAVRWADDCDGEKRS